MTLLNKSDKEQASYLDIAEFLSTKGSAAHLKEDLQELFRRVVFNVAMGNRDDHLRNHGFMRHASGWRLEPNPGQPRVIQSVSINWFTTSANAGGASTQEVWPVSNTTNRAFGIPPASSSA
jgi:hypothetical protein